MYTRPTEPSNPHIWRPSHYPTSTQFANNPGRGINTLGLCTIHGACYGPFPPQNYMCWCDIPSAWKSGFLPFWSVLLLARCHKNSPMKLGHPKRKFFRSRPEKRPDWPWNFMFTNPNCCREFLSQCSSWKKGSKNRKTGLSNTRYTSRDISQGCRSLGQSILKV